MATDKLTQTVALNVQSAMEAAGENLLSMERATGITRSVLRLRLTGKSPWKTPEIAACAAHFGVDADALCATNAEVAA